MKSSRKSWKTHQNINSPIHLYEAKKSKKYMYKNNVERMKSFKRDSSFRFFLYLFLQHIIYFLGEAHKSIRSTFHIFFLSFRFYYCSNQSYKYIERYCHVRITFIDAKAYIAMEQMFVWAKENKNNWKSL